MIAVLVEACGDTIGSALAAQDDSLQRRRGDRFDFSALKLLPNTAGCSTAEAAVRVAQLARAMSQTSWVKLEVIPDATYLIPDSVETLRAAEELAGEGVAVPPYMPPDPVLAAFAAFYDSASREWVESEQVESPRLRPAREAC